MLRLHSGVLLDRYTPRFLIKLEIRGNTMDDPMKNSFMYEDSMLIPDEMLKSQTHVTQETMAPAKKKGGNGSATAQDTQAFSLSPSEMSSVIGLSTSLAETLNNTSKKSAEDVGFNLFGRDVAKQLEIINNRTRVDASDTGENRLKNTDTLTGKPAPDMNDPVAVGEFIVDLKTELDRIEEKNTGTYSFMRYAGAGLGALGLLLGSPALFFAGGMTGGLAGRAMKDARTRTDMLIHDIVSGMFENAKRGTETDYQKSMLEMREDEEIEKKKNELLARHQDDDTPDRFIADVLSSDLPEEEKKAMATAGYFETTKPGKPKTDIMVEKAQDRQSKSAAAMTRLNVTGKGIRTSFEDGDIEGVRDNLWAKEDPQGTSSEVELFNLNASKEAKPNLISIDREIDGEKILTPENTIPPSAAITDTARWAAKQAGIPLEKEEKDGFVLTKNAIKPQVSNAREKWNYPVLREISTTGSIAQQANELFIMFSEEPYGKQTRMDNGDVILQISLGKPPNKKYHDYVDFLLLGREEPKGRVFMKDEVLQKLDEAAKEDSFLDSGKKRLVDMIKDLSQ